MKGYIKLYRKFFSHWLWDEERVYNRPEAFLDLLQLAVFAPTKRVVQAKLISLEVGELVASERFLEVRWKWSRTKVRRFLNVLKSDQMLSQRKDQGETVLILLNYKEFHECRTLEKTSNDTTEEPEANQRRTGGEPNNKKDKKVKELEEEKKAPKSPKGDLSAAALISQIPKTFSQDRWQSAVDWAEDKQARGQKRHRFQSVRAWHACLKRMALYPPEVLAEAVQCAIASTWQGWEQESVKEKLNHGKLTKGTFRGQSEASKESSEIRKL